MNRKILIIGATSAIAQEVAKLYAKSNDDLLLVGRNQHRLEAITADLCLRGKGKTHYEVLDLNDFDKHTQLLSRAEHELKEIDVVLIAYGSLPDQKACEASFEKTVEELNTNFISVVSLLTLFANYFEKRKRGSIAVISSVAGDRGRQSNYVYGAAKGGLSIFLQGLRNRLTKSNVSVLTVKPGFVDTPMTKDFKKGALWASPEFVAKKIVDGIDKKSSVLYVPFFWRYIMAIIKSIPEKVFSRMSL